MKGPPLLALLLQMFPDCRTECKQPAANGDRVIVSADHGVLIEEACHHTLSLFAA